MSNRAVAVAALSLSISVAAIAAHAQSGIRPEQSQPLPMANGNNIGTVSGSIQSVDGRPVPDARIDLKDLNNGATLASTYSKSNGSFQMSNVAAGQYEVVGTSGLSETRDRVQVTPGVAFVTLHISAPVSEPSAGATVSVAQMKVPGKARKEYEKAKDSFNDSKFDDAKEHVAKALEIFPVFAEALTLRGLLAINEHNDQAGEADLQSAIKADSNYAMAYFAMGALMNQNGKFEDALRSLDRGVTIAPDAWQGYFEISKASLGKGDFERALKSINKAQNLADKDYAPLHLVKAHALLGLKRYDAAVAELEGYLQREPDGSAAANARKTLDRTKAFVSRGSGSARAETSTGTP